MKLNYLILPLYIQINLKCDSELKVTLFTITYSFNKIRSIK